LRIYMYEHPRHHKLVCTLAAYWFLWPNLPSFRTLLCCYTFVLLPVCAGEKARSTKLRFCLMIRFFADSIYIALRYITLHKKIVSAAIVKFTVIIYIYFSSKVKVKSRASRPIYSPVHLLKVKGTSISWEGQQIPTCTSQWVMENS